jgi:hypothetical protein
MGNTYSVDSPTKPLSSNESITPVNLNQSIFNLKKIIKTLETDNNRYYKELLKKQELAQEYIRRNNMEAARIFTQQLVGYRNIIKKNMITIKQFEMLIQKLQETKNTEELKRLVNQANSVEVSEQNPLFRGGKYFEKLIKYEDKLLGLMLN